MNKTLVVKPSVHFFSTSGLVPCGDQIEEPCDGFENHSKNACQIFSSFFNAAFGEKQQQIADDANDIDNSDCCCDTQAQHKSSYKHKRLTTPDFTPLMRGLRPLIYLAVIISLYVSLSFAQSIPAGFIQTTGTYSLLANGSIEADFVNQSGQNQLPLLGGFSVFPIQVAGKIDSYGHFSILLADNNQITPAPSQWKFNITVPCPAPTNQGGYNVQTTVTINAGANTQDISTLLINAYPSLICGPNQGGGGGGSGSVLPSPQFSLFYQPTVGTSATAIGDAGISTDAQGHLTAKTFKGQQVGQACDITDAIYGGGADQTGATDISTAVIPAALAAGCTRLYFPQKPSGAPATYKMSQQLLIGGVSGLFEVSGPGEYLATINYTGAGVPVQSAVGTTGIDTSFTHISGIHINNSGTGTTGIDLSGLAHMTLEKTWVSGFSVQQILADSSCNGGYYNGLDALYIQPATGGIGISLRGDANAFTLSNISIQGGAKSLEIGAASNCSIANTGPTDQLSATNISMEAATSECVHIISGDGINFFGGRCEASNRPYYVEASGASTVAVRGLEVVNPTYPSVFQNAFAWVDAEGIGIPYSQHFGVTTEGGGNMLPNAGFEGFNGSLPYGYSNVASQTWGSTTSTVTQENVIVNSGSSAARIGTTPPVSSAGMSTTAAVPINPSVPYTLKYNVAATGDYLTLVRCYSDAAGANLLNYPTTHVAVAGGILTITAANAPSSLIGQNLFLQSTYNQLETYWPVTAVTSTTVTASTLTTATQFLIAGDVVTIYVPNTYVSGSSVTVSGLPVSAANGTFTLTSASATSIQYNATAANTALTNTSATIELPNLASSADTGYLQQEQLVETSLYQNTQWTNTSLYWSPFVTPSSGGYGAYVDGTSQGTPLPTTYQANTRVLRFPDGCNSARFAWMTVLPSVTPTLVEGGTGNGGFTVSTSTASGTLPSGYYTVEVAYATRNYLLGTEFVDTAIDPGDTKYPGPEWSQASDGPVSASYTAYLSAAGTITVTPPGQDATNLATGYDVFMCYQGSVPGVCSPTRQNTTGQYGSANAPVGYRPVAQIYAASVTGGVATVYTNLAAANAAGAGCSTPVVSSSNSFNTSGGESVYMYAEYPLNYLNSTISSPSTTLSATPNYFTVATTQGNTAIQCTTYGAASVYSPFLNKNIASNPGVGSPVNYVLSTNTLTTTGSPIPGYTYLDDISLTQGAAPLQITPKPLTDTGPQYINGPLTLEGQLGTITANALNVPIIGVSNLVTNSSFENYATTGCPGGFTPCPVGWSPMSVTTWPSTVSQTIQQSTVNVESGSYSIKIGPSSGTGGAYTVTPITVANPTSQYTLGFYYAVDNTSQAVVPLMRFFSDATTCSTQITSGTISFSGTTTGTATYSTGFNAFEFGLLSTSTTNLVTHQVYTFTPPLGTQCTQIAFSSGVGASGYGYVDAVFFGPGTSDASPLVNTSGLQSSGPSFFPLIPDGCADIVGGLLGSTGAPCGSGGGGGGTITGVTAGTGLAGGGTTGTVTLSLATPVAVANGGTGTASPGDVGSTYIGVSGTWPNQTITWTATATQLSALLSGLTNCSTAGNLYSPGANDCTVVTLSPTLNPYYIPYINSSNQFEADSTSVIYIPPGTGTIASAVLSYATTATPVTFLLNGTYVENTGNGIALPDAGVCINLQGLATSSTIIQETPPTIGINGAWSSTGSAATITQSSGTPVTVGQQYVFSGVTGVSGLAAQPPVTVTSVSGTSLPLTFTFSTTTIASGSGTITAGTGTLAGMIVLGKTGHASTPANCSYKNLTIDGGTAAAFDLDLVSMTNLQLENIVFQNIARGENGAWQIGESSGSYPTTGAETKNLKCSMSGSTYNSTTAPNYCGVIQTSATDGHFTTTEGTNVKELYRVLGGSDVFDGQNHVYGGGIATAGAYVTARAELSGFEFDELTNTGIIFGTGSDGSAISNSFGVYNSAVSGATFASIANAVTNIRVVNNDWSAYTGNSLTTPVVFPGTRGSGVILCANTPDFGSQNNCGSGGTTYPDITDSAGTVGINNATVASATTLNVGTTGTTAAPALVFGNTVLPGEATFNCYHTATYCFNVVDDYQTLFSVQPGKVQLNVALDLNNEYINAGENNVTACTGTQTFYFSAVGNSCKLTGNVTFSTIAAPTSGGYYGQISTLDIIQTTGNSYTVTFPSNIGSIGGTVVTVTAGKSSLYTLQWLTAEGRAVLLSSVLNQ